MRPATGKPATTLLDRHRGEASEARHGGLPPGGLPPGGLPPGGLPPPLLDRHRGEANEARHRGALPCQRKVETSLRQPTTRLLPPGLSKAPISAPGAFDSEPGPVRTPIRERLLPSLPAVGPYSRIGMAIETMVLSPCWVPATDTYIGCLSPRCLESLSPLRRPPLHGGHATLTKTESARPGLLLLPPRGERVDRWFHPTRLPPSPPLPLARLGPRGDQLRGFLGFHGEKVELSSGSHRPVGGHSPPSRSSHGYTPSACMLSRSVLREILSSVAAPVMLRPRVMASPTATRLASLRKSSMVGIPPENK